jgi:hypothetical protein
MFILGAAWPVASFIQKLPVCSSTDQGGGKRRLGLGTASFLLAISMFQHAIPTHIRPQVRDLALRGLVALMVAVEITTLLWWRRTDDDHQNEGCGINHGDLFTRSATRRTALAVPAHRSTTAAGSGDRVPGIDGGPYDPWPPRRERGNHNSPAAYRTILTATSTCSLGGDDEAGAGLLGGPRWR